MNDILVVVVSHNELTRRGEEVLRRSLNSLTRARDTLARQRPGIDAYVACCDDASSDATPEFIEKHFAGQSGFRMVHHRQTQGSAVSRNTAAMQFDTEAICMLDADDEYLENHLVVCSDILGIRDEKGLKLAAATTTAEFNVPVHPHWALRIGATLPITKIIRRRAWHFVEGMPTAQVYTLVGGEDQCLIEKLSLFFKIVMYPDVTARYYSYPGSYFQRQLPKFNRPPELYNPSVDDPADTMPHRQARRRLELAFLQYLKEKAAFLGLRELFPDYVPRA